MSNEWIKIDDKRSLPSRLRCVRIRTEDGEEVDAFLGSNYKFSPWFGERAPYIVLHASHWRECQIDGDTT